MNRQPIQPLITDNSGVIRFRENKIVRYLLDNGGIDLNHIAILDFPRDDREQFAQLIGYSLSGFGDLSYATPETCDAAERMVETGESDAEARANVLRETVDSVREGARDAIAKLYGVHPDNLNDDYDG